MTTQSPEASQPAEEFQVQIVSRKRTTRCQSDPLVAAKRTFTSSPLRSLESRGEKATPGLQPPCFRNRHDGATAGSSILEAQRPASVPHPPCPTSGCSKPDDPETDSRSRVHLQTRRRRSSRAVLKLRCHERREHELSLANTSVNRLDIGRPRDIHNEGASGCQWNGTPGVLPQSFRLRANDQAFLVQPGRSPVPFYGQDEPSCSQVFGQNHEIGTPTTRPGEPCSLGRPPQRREANRPQDVARERDLEEVARSGYNGPPVIKRVVANMFDQRDTACPVRKDVLNRQMGRVGHCDNTAGIVYDSRNRDPRPHRCAPYQVQLHALAQIPGTEVELCTEVNRMDSDDCHQKRAEKRRNHNGHRGTPGTASDRAELTRTAAQTPRPAARAHENELEQLAP